MPITVRVVTDDEYAEWLADAKVKFAKDPIEQKIELAKTIKIREEIK